MTRYRAPADSGGLLFAPPPAAVAPALAAPPVPAGALGDHPLAELRTALRADVVRLVGDYLREGNEPVPTVGEGPWLVAGHQPELFHPGVWAKNFALAGLARPHGGVAFNLVIDNDTAKAASLRVPCWPGPAGPPRATHAAPEPFDRFATEVPYEERQVNDEALFATFGERVLAHTKHWPFRPLLEPFWPMVLGLRDRTPLLGERFAGARRALERHWGVANLELPLSRLCQTAAFAKFATTILLDLPRFAGHYNAAAAEYRREYRIRSASHPVPDLTASGEWTEAPLWAWRAGDQRRARLYARRDDHGLHLRAGDEAWPTLPLTKPEEAWPDLERQGYKVRTRALTTTMFARLCLADLFLHGIGGGKYDELTDRIIARHFGVTPAPYAVMTATLRLPFPPYAATPTAAEAWHREQRDRYWNPERHAVAPANLLARKRELIASDPPTRRGRRERYAELRRVGDALRAAMAVPDDFGLGDAAERERQHDELRANALLGRRDYSFCLFPEAALRERMEACVALGAT